MKLSETSKLLDSLCDDLLGQLLCQPQAHRSISVTDIEVAAASLGWPDPGSSKYVQDSDLVAGEAYSNKELMRLSLAPMRESSNHKVSLSVLTFYANEWKQISAQPRITHVSNVPMPESLPDGLREFLYQLESVYTGSDIDSGTNRLTKDDIVECVSRSEHLVIIFPLITRFTVRKIKQSLRESDVSDLIELLNALVMNAQNRVSSDGEFEIILNCLLDLIVDPSLAILESEENRMSVRRTATGILLSLLRLKLGAFHATKLAQELITDILEPLVMKTISMKTVPSPPLMSSLAGAMIASETLISAFGLPGLKEDLKSRLRKFLSLCKDEPSVCVETLKKFI
jgi:hypothetical protein